MNCSIFLGANNLAPSGVSIMTLIGGGVYPLHNTESLIFTRRKEGYCFLVVLLDQVQYLCKILINILRI